MKYIVYCTVCTKNGKILKIDQYDLNGNYIKTWNSYSECRKEHPNVKQVLSGGRNHTHGFIFKIHELS